MLSYENSHKRSIASMSPCLCYWRDFRYATTRNSVTVLTNSKRTSKRWLTPHKTTIEIDDITKGKYLKLRLFSLQLKKNTYSSNPETATHTINTDAPSLGLFNISQNRMAGEGYTNPSSDNETFQQFRANNPGMTYVEALRAWEAKKRGKHLSDPNTMAPGGPHLYPQLPPTTPAIVGGILLIQKDNTLCERRVRKLLLTLHQS